VPISVEPSVGFDEARVAHHDVAVVATAALSTVSVVFPGLAAGSLAVQASDDFGVSEGSYGWALGTFFLAAALTSVAGGRLAQRLGPRRQLSYGLVGAAAVQLSIAFVVPSFGWMLVALALAGVVNSGVQTAVNLALSQAELPRLGLAVATKQSAMPAAAMLGGLAVPAVALTLGWRWAYAMGALVGLVGFACVRAFIIDRPITAASKVSVVESTSRALAAATAVSMLFAFSSGAINAWTVSSGVDAGLSEGAAGLFLGLAAGMGILFRLAAGARVDASKAPPFRMAAQLYLIGIVGFVLLSARVAPLHAGATVLAFAGGWIWPVFTNFAIVNANPRSAGAATGMTQMGVYVGVFSAPVITGGIIDRWGYQTMWLVVAGVAMCAAVIAVAVSPSFPRTG
jgi:MFS family permease